ncbi:MAG: RnfABCDGE type electron transport complex subunit B [Candidatus Paceibacterales bacterium]
MKLAVINEAECIGCTKCIQVCPFDAIIGANKQMHTILETECTGCGLCIDPCPVDCIDMIPIDKPLFNMERAKSRRRARRERLRKHHVTDQKMELTKEMFALPPNTIQEAKSEIAKILERVKKKQG